MAASGCIVDAVIRVYGTRPGFSGVPVRKTSSDSCLLLLKIETQVLVKRPPIARVVLVVETSFEVDIRIVLEVLKRGFLVAEVSKATKLAHHQVSSDTVVALGSSSHR